MKNLYKIGDDLYIVSSSEKIKENTQTRIEGLNGDWFYNTIYNFIARTGDITSYDFKIILTTNKLLIQDGVQAIDDEFLQWFVQNPSCENVKVELIEEIPSGFTFGMFGNDEPPTELVYKIIIPIEEPKQETVNMNKNTHYVDFSNPNADKISSASTTTIKQETLEEGKLRQLFRNRSNCYADADDVVQAMDENCFIETINEWQQERSQQIIPFDAYNIEVFAIKPDENGKLFAYIGYKITNGNFHFNVVPFTEPQQERSYSEGDLREAYFSAIKSTGEGWNGEYANGNNPNIEEKFTEGFEEWFEQFKKK